MRNYRIRQIQTSHSEEYYVEKRVFPFCWVALKFTGELAPDSPLGEGFFVENQAMLTSWKDAMWVLRKQMNTPIVNHVTFYYP